MKHLIEYFEFRFSDAIEKLDKSKCINFQSAFLGFVSIFVGILGFLSSRFSWLIWIALFLTSLGIIVFCGTNSVVRKIEAEEEKLKDEYNKIKEECQEYRENMKYWQKLYTESSLIISAIQTANKNKKVKALYTKIADSIAEMVSFYSKIQSKNNYLVNVYVLDSKRKLVSRVAVQSYVHTFAEPCLTEPHSIGNAVMKKKYYVKALKSKRTYFTLKNNELIREALDFEGVDEKIVSQYTQYIGMTYAVGEKVKLYIEVVSFNDQLLYHEDQLDIYLNKVVAPFASLIRNVDWDSIWEVK